MTVMYRVLWTFDARAKIEDYSTRKDAMRRANDLVSLGHKVRVQKGSVAVWSDVRPSQWGRIHS